MVVRSAPWALARATTAPINPTVAGRKKRMGALLAIPTAAVTSTPQITASKNLEPMIRLR